MSREFFTMVDQITERDPRYKEDAYTFVMEALTHTQKKYKSVKHVSGEEMLEGIKELAINKFGPMVKNVFEHWGICTTEDFGYIVFNLVDNRVLSKTENDHIDNFRDGFDFDEVFEHGYRRQLAKKISRMRSI